MPNPISGQDGMRPTAGTSHDRLRLAVRAANVGLWDWDLVTNRVYYSPEWKRQIGYDNDEIRDNVEEWQSRLHPEDLERTLASVRAYLDRRAPDYEVEFRLRHKDGSFRWILAQGALVTDPDGKPRHFQGAHVDITQRRRAEEALRASEELHRVTLANISDTVLIADETGRISYVCPSVDVVFGYSPADALALGHIEKLLGPDIYDPAELEARTELHNIERVITDRNGGQRVLLVNIKRMPMRTGSVLFSCRDITERRQTDELFRSLVKGTAAVGEEFFRSLVRELATALGMRCALVGEILPETPEHVRTLAVWSDGKLAENFEYSLRGTPCENVVGQSLCHYAADVQRAFPEDRLLAEIGAVSYLGTPLFSSAGQPLGLAVVLDDRPMTESERAKSVLSVFAARAGAELERVRTERALRRSEELFRAVVGDQTEMIVRWKPDGTCTFVNQAYCHAVGRSFEELVGARFLPSIAPMRIDAIQQRLRPLSPAEPVASHIHESTSPTGRLHWEEWTDRGLFGADGRLLELQSTGRDITERRRTEMRVRQLNRVYALLSSINEVILRGGDQPRLFDAACCIAVEQGGFLMAWIGQVGAEPGTLKCVAHGGATAETLAFLESMFADPQRACAFTTHAAHAGEHAICNNIALDARAASWRGAALERGYRSMASLPLKNGSELVAVFNLYSSETGFFDEQEMRLLDELAMDIGFALQIRQREAERRRVEAACAESEERFRQLTEAIQEVFWMTDAAKSRVLYVSPAYATVWGRSCQSVYDAPRSWMDAIHPDDRERVMKDAVTRQVEGTYEEEYRITRPDGALRWIHDRAFPVRDADGQVKCVVGVARDVTEQRHLEAQFFQSQKMEAIGQLAGGVAHDFNNILAAILMQIELAATGDNVSAATRDDLKQIRLYAERAANLTRQLLLFSRRQVMQLRDLDLNEIVTSLAKMLQRIIGEDVRLQLHLHPSPLVVRGDPGMLDQVIMNLAINARDAMPRGGRLLIETSEKLVDDSYAHLHPEVATGRYGWMSISDTGTGIVPEVLPRIFEPFFTTKEPGKGTGLGLATVHGIVKQHGGWIEVQSEPGAGATFEVFLPAGSASTTTLRDAAASAPRRGNETILLVEDETPVRVLLRTVLERHGYRVIEAGSGDEAQHLWDQHHEEIDLLLSDLVMPGELSGQELARRARAEAPDLKVILISGYSADLASREQGLRAGENFLQKPFGPDQILGTVRRCLDE